LLGSAPPIGDAIMDGHRYHHQNVFARVGRADETGYVDIPEGEPI
jgi:hypothetical protein